MRVREELPHFVFKGRRSLDYGLIVTKKKVHSGAQRDVSYESVPGRDGDLIVDNGRYKNVPISYELAMLNKMTPWTFEELAQIVRDWVIPGPGYYELWDTYDPRYYRLAAFTGEVNIEQELNDLGTLTLDFSCKPFRYSAEGRQTITLTETGTVVYNGEAYASKPYIKVTGSGNITLTVAGENYYLSGVDGYIEIDSETMNAYKGSANLNSSLTGASFPLLQPGANTISWSGSGTVTKVEIIPRWCTL